MVVPAEQVIGVRDLRGNSVGVRRRRLVVQFGIGAAIQEIGDGDATGRRADAESEQSSPEPSSHGPSLEVFPLATFWLKVAVVRERLQRCALREVERAVDAGRQIPVGDLVWRGELRAAIGLEQLDRRGAGSDSRWNVQR